MSSKTQRPAVPKANNANKAKTRSGLTTIAFLLGGVLALGAALYNPLELRVRVLGINRPLPIQNMHGEEIRVIPDTPHAEDLHVHEPSGLIFTASEESEECRWKWFPPMSFISDPEPKCQGTIVVIDPWSMTSKRLTLGGFSGPFYTHGIDIWSPPDDPNSVFIYAVNHLPNPEWTPTSPASTPRARSQIELLHHNIGSQTVEYVRSIWHPLIRTPNDIYTINKHEIYVTNDHYYRDEGLLRFIEDIGFQSVAGWTDTVHVTINSLESGNATADVSAEVALDKLHNNNGLGHGRDSNEILIGRAAAGALVLAKPIPVSTTQSSRLEILETIQLDSTIDNPSYFRDPYAQSTGRDASGFIIAGLPRAINWPAKDGKDPVYVWHVAPKEGGGWEKKLIFVDDSSTIRSASTAVLVAIDPKKNAGKKQGWLFVTGPVSKNAIATRIDL